MQSGDLSLPQRIRTFFAADQNLITAAWVILTLCAFLSLTPNYAPIQDYLEWVFHGALGKAMLTAETPSTLFFFHDYPIANSLIQFLLIGLNFIMPPDWAQRVVLLLYFGLVAALIASLRKLSPKAGVVGGIVMCVSILLGSQYFNGYMNNMFGNVLLLIYFSNALRRPPSLWETFAFSILIFFCHATSFVVFCMIVGLTAIWPIKEISVQKITRALPVIPAGLMFIWYTLAKYNYVDEGLNISSFKELVFYKLYTIAKLGPFHNFFVGDVGYLERAPLVFWLGIAANLGFAAILCILALRFFRPLDRSRWMDPAWLAAAILLVAYPFMPRTVSGVVNIGERFLTIAVLLMIVWLMRSAPTIVLRYGGWTASLLIGSLLLFSEFSFRGVHSSDTVIASTIPDQSSERLRRLFWHRPYLYAGRVADIDGVVRGGVNAAHTFSFESSIIGWTNSKPSLGEPSE